MSSSMLMISLDKLAVELISLSNRSRRKTVLRRLLLNSNRTRGTPSTNKNSSSSRLPSNSKSSSYPREY